MNVLVVSGIWPPDVGGPASHAPELAAFLRSRGHGVEVVTTADVAPEAPDFPIHAVLRSTPVGVRHARVVALVARRARSADVVYATSMISRAGLGSTLARRPLVLKLVADAAYERAKRQGLFAGSLAEFQRGAWAADRGAPARPRPRPPPRVACRLPERIPARALAGLGARGGEGDGRPERDPAAAGAAVRRRGARRARPRAAAARIRRPDQRAEGARRPARGAGAGRRAGARARRRRPRAGPARDAGDGARARRPRSLPRRPHPHRGARALSRRRRCRAHLRAGRTSRTRSSRRSRWGRRCSEPRSAAWPRSCATARTGCSSRRAIRDAFAERATAISRRRGAAASGCARRPQASVDASPTRARLRRARADPRAGGRLVKPRVLMVGRTRYRLPALRGPRPQVRRARRAARPPRARDRNPRQPQPTARVPAPPPPRVARTRRRRLLCAAARSGSLASCASFDRRWCWRRARSRQPRPTPAGRSRGGACRSSSSCTATGRASRASTARGCDNRSRLCSTGSLRGRCAAPTPSERSRRSRPSSRAATESSPRPRSRPTPTCRPSPIRRRSPSLSVRARSSSASSSATRTWTGSSPRGGSRRRACPDARLVLVGEGPMRAEVERLVADLPEQTAWHAALPTPEVVTRTRRRVVPAPPLSLGGDAARHPRGALPGAGGDRRPRRRDSRCRARRRERLPRRTGRRGGDRGCARPAPLGSRARRAARRAGARGLAAVALHRRRVRRQRRRARRSASPR